MELNGENIINILQEKGWNLYEYTPNTSFDLMVKAGRATKLKFDGVYKILPYSSLDSSPDHLNAHLNKKVSRNPLLRIAMEPIPTFPFRASRIHVKEIVFGKDSMSLIPYEPLDFQYEQKIDISYSVIEDRMKHDLSSYNTLFFDSISEIDTLFREHYWKTSRIAPAPENVRWTLVTKTKTSDEDSIYAITPISRPLILFRGQTQRFSPCLSSLSRCIGSKSISSRNIYQNQLVDLLINQVRSAWFAECIQRTNLFKWMNSMNFYMNEYAVAQHYGLATTYIDFTESIEVAKFFACCDFDSSNNSWTPRSNDYGIVYAVDHTLLFDFHPTERLIMEPINLQPFPRPSEQWGWTYSTHLAENLENSPYIVKLIFRHDSKLSEEIYRKFNFGADLFPADPTHDLADIILKAVELPLYIAEAEAKNLIDRFGGNSVLSIQQLVSMAQSKRGISFSQNPVDPLSGKLLADYDRVWSQRSAQLNYILENDFALTIVMADS